MTEPVKGFRGSWRWAESLPPNSDWITVKPIYDAPIVDQIKDLKRACENVLDIIDTLPLRPVGPEDIRREGLQKGEFALCDWIIRPRFSCENTKWHCANERTEIPVSFSQWWNGLTPSPNLSEHRIIHGGKLGCLQHFEIDEGLALAMWQSMGLQTD